jgi:protein FAM161A
MSASLTDFSEDKVSSDAFYQKLLQLKEAHKKTLQMYEQLYTEQKKADAPCNNTSGEITRSQLASLENLLSADVHSAGGVSDSWREVDQSRVIQPSVTKDSVKDLSASKPPSGRPLASEGIPMRSSAVKTYTGTEVGSDAGSYRHQSSLSGDVAEYETSDDEQHKENTDNVSSQSFIDTRQSAMARIGDMWERFSVDNYCPRSSEVRTKPGMFRSNSMSRISLSAREPRRSSTIDRGGSAKKRVTVPKPFSMSMREANQTPRKSRAAIELEQREEERRYAEELECQKKFKAMPLPAHIHFRLYDELNEERESRRRFIVQHRQELLNTMQKPFQFTSREEEKKKAKADSKATGLQQRGRPHFRAHPFPSRIFDDSVVDKMREEDEYRKIRMKVRAKDLLRSSSLPPTMRLRGKDYTDGRERQKLFAERAKKAGITIEHKFRPKINHTIPDFDKQYDKFMQDLAEAKKYQREATVCRPFNLRTSTGRLNNRANRKSSMDEFSEADDSFNHNMPFSKSYTGNLSTSGTFAGMLSART